MAVYCFAIKFKNLVKVANILQSLKHIEKECNNTLSLTTTLSKLNSQYIALVHTASNIGKLQSGQILLINAVN
jgi:hypothetical protein